MYDVIIVDDDLCQADATMRAVGSFPASEEIFSLRVFGGIDELEAHLQSGGKADILVTDIVFDGSERGIDAVRRLSDQGYDMQVIYVTGYIDYCTSVYQTKHTSFLTKPINQHDLDDALERAIENLLAAKRSRSLVLTSQGKVICVAPDEVEYIESNRRKVLVHAVDRVIESYASLSELSDRVPESFTRCHKSFLVNMDRIVELDGGEAVMRSGARVPVSQRFRRPMRERLIEYLMAKD